MVLQATPLIGTAGFNSRQLRNNLKLGQNFSVRYALQYLFARMIQTKIGAQ